MRSPILILLFYLFQFFPSNSLAQSSLNNLAKRLRENTITYQQAVLKGDSSTIAEASYLIAKRHIGLGNYSQAQIWLQKALDIRIINSDFESIGKIYLRMEEIQFILQRPREAIKLSGLALKNFNKIDSDHGRMSAYNALGACHFLMWEIHQADTLRYRSSFYHAIRYYNASLKVAEAIGSPIDIGQDYRYLAKCWNYKDKKMALIYQKKAWNIDSTANLFDNSIELACDIAVGYLREGKVAMAKQWLDKAQKIIITYENPSIGLKNSLEVGYAQYYEATNKLDLAYKHLKASTTLQDGLFQQYRNEAMEGTKILYETKLKEVELKGRRNEISILKNSAATKNRLLLGIVALLVIAAFASILYSVLFLKYKSLSKYNATLVKEQSHRTKNNLQAICNLLSLQLYKLSDSPASRILEESIYRVEAINMIHNKLHRDGMPMFIALPDYVNDLIVSLLRVYKMEFISTNISIEPIWLHAEKAVPLGLIINELTTNACKYAFLSENPELSVTCQFIDKNIVLYFKDDGKGFDQKNNAPGFGLELIDMLIDQLNGTGGFTFDKGFQFNLSIPVDEHQILSTKPKITATAS